MCHVYPLFNPFTSYPIPNTYPTLYTIHSTPYTLHPTPYTLHPILTLHSTPYTLHRTPYTLHPTPNTYPTLYTPHSTPYTLHPILTLHATRYTIHFTPYTLHHTLYTLHSTPYTLYFTRYTLHSTPYILHRTPSPPAGSLHYTPKTTRAQPVVRSSAPATRQSYTPCLSRGYCRHIRGERIRRGHIRWRMKSEESSYMTQDHAMPPCKPMKMCLHNRKLFRSLYPCFSYNLPDAPLRRFENRKLRSTGPFTCQGQSIEVEL